MKFESRDITKIGLNRWDILVLTMVAIIGVFHLPTPFMGDQALISLMAKEISHGKLIYHDLWDLKWPGVFFFYLLGGTLFGFHEIGIHLFELIYLLIFSTVLILVFKDYFQHRWIASVSPLFIVGYYYLASGVWHQTQTETLVGFPLFLTLYLASTYDRPSNPSRKLFWSGLFGGSVMVFKFAFAGIVGIFWLIVLANELVFVKRKFGRVIRTMVVPLAIGCALPLVTVVIYFAVNGLLPIAFWTFFEYPAKLLQDLPWRWPVLKEGVLFFINKFSPLMALGAFGALGALFSSHRRKDLITINLLAWCFFGLVTILIQRTSWWEYHFFLLLPPIGLLALKGLDLLCGCIDSGFAGDQRLLRQLLLPICLLLLFSPLLFKFIDDARMVTQKILLTKGNGIVEYQKEKNVNYRFVLDEIAFLDSKDKSKEEIYVFGNPLFYTLSGRSPAISLLATWFWSVPELWQTLQERLISKRPKFIFIQKDSLASIRKCTPKVSSCLSKTMPLIHKYYKVIRKSDFGSWYMAK